MTAPATRIVVWVTEGSWRATVDAAARIAAPTFAPAGVTPVRTFRVMPARYRGERPAPVTADAVLG